jgi:hypothetical protein
MLPLGQQMLLKMAPFCLFCLGYTALHALEHLHKVFCSICWHVYLKFLIFQISFLCGASHTHYIYIYIYIYEIRVSLYVFCIEEARKQLMGRNSWFYRQTWRHPIYYMTSYMQDI